MIFVAVGTQKFSFNRLLKNIDDLIEAGAITEEVFAQIGNSDYIPKNFKYISFMSKEDFDSTVERSSLVITHSGVGTIISAISRHKPIIVCPRLSKYGEHVDDHQLEIAQYFSKMKYILMCNDGEALLDVINIARDYEFAEYKSQKAKAVETIRTYLKSL
ncbi:MAG: glycosyl transferase [Clostridia bacterium]|nr:glycosyl transferase [Clostridia bacterium]